MDLLKDVPLVRHAVMGYFQGFPIDNREVIEAAMQNAKTEDSRSERGEK